METSEIEEITADDYINNIKAEFFNRYGYNIYVVTESSKFLKLPLNELEDLCIKGLKEYSNERIKSLSIKIRKRDIVTVRQIFFYIAVNKYQYPKLRAGKYLKRNHSTVIHAIKTCENHIFTKNKDFLKAFDIINSLIEKYVGNISNNSTRENYSESNAIIV